jgi:acylphosphatase
VRRLAQVEEVIRRRVVVDGRVQGVFFRDSCQREAAARRLGGWVRNRNDGAVEAVFEGPADAVDAVVAWCRTGPPRARVDRVTVSDEPPEGLTSFRVRGWD